MKGRFLIAMIAAVASVTGFQNTDNPPQAPVFRSTARLVQVNVVATDKNGKRVADLRKEDFAVFEDGRPQKIEIFVSEEAKPINPPILPRNQFRNQLPSANTTRSGYTLILVDWLNSSMFTRIGSQQQVLKLLRQVEMTDLVALCVLDRDLRVLHEFTADRAELVKKLSATRVGLSQGPPSEQSGITAFPLFLTEVEHSPVADVALRRTTRSLEIRRSLDTISALEQIASYLGTAPGRKNMIWVTSGFPSAMGFDGDMATDKDAWSSAMSDDRRTFSQDANRLVRLLNEANIAVYPVDARGLIADVDPTAAGRAAVNLAAMKEIANRTGGRVYHNDNELDNAIRSALDDATISYTLGYYSSNTKKDGAYRSVNVKVNRPGVTLRYRTGYDAEKQIKSRTPSKIDLQQVFGSPLDATALPLTAHAVRTGGKLDVSLGIDPSTLTLRNEFGRRRGGLSVFYAFRSENGADKVQIFSASNKLDLPEDLYPKFLQQGLRTFRKQIPIPANAMSLRLALRDEESGLVGSVTIPLTAVQ